MRTKNSFINPSNDVEMTLGNVADLHLADEWADYNQQQVVKQEVDGEGEDVGTQPQGYQADVCLESAPIVHLETTDASLLGKQESSFFSLIPLKLSKFAKRK